MGSFLILEIFVDYFSESENFSIFFYSALQNDRKWNSIKQSVFVHIPLIFVEIRIFSFGQIRQL
jgi:hypothetical protein